MSNSSCPLIASVATGIVTVFEQGLWLTWRQLVIVQKVYLLDDNVYINPYQLSNLKMSFTQISKLPTSSSRSPPSRPNKQQTREGPRPPLLRPLFWYFSTFLNKLRISACLDQINLQLRSNPQGNAHFPVELTGPTGLSHDTREIPRPQILREKKTFVPPWSQVSPSLRASSGFLTICIVFKIAVIQQFSQHLLLISWRSRQVFFSRCFFLLLLKPKLLKKTKTSFHCLCDEARHHGTVCGPLLCWPWTKILCGCCGLRILIKPKRIPSATCTRYPVAKSSKRWVFPRRWISGFT